MATAMITGMETGEIAESYTCNELTGTVPGEHDAGAGMTRRESGSAPHL